MKRSSILLGIIGIAIVFVLGFSAQASARVAVYVAPPAFAFEGPPSVVVIPGTYVYRVPDIETDILFYGGFWYRPYEGRWYRSRHYNGPWAHIGRVPRSLIGLPPDWRLIPYERHHFVPYGDLHRNWRRWERDRHWRHDERWRDDRWRHDGRRDGGHHDGGHPGGHPGGHR